jgi:alcohol dehydrogenase (cytochrome c)
MRRSETARRALLATILLSPAPIWCETPRAAPVDDARLSNPEPRNWLMYRGNYASWGYSPLDQIRRENVSGLKPVWTFSTGVGEGHQSPPIVNDGILYVTTPGNQVLALDAAKGDLLWRYQRDLPDELQPLHPTNRGVALYSDKLYFGTVDAFVVALNARTGELVWEKAIEDYKNGYYVTLAPLAARGKVMVGVSGGELGVRGFVEALDAETGESRWKTYTIPGPGEPGHDTWPEDAWATGGASVWITGSFDPERGLTYWGTGNAAPWIGEARPGDNLYSSSVVALDVETGALTGHHQYHWNDSWDWDEVSAPLLIDVEREGKKIEALVHPARNGYLWLLSRNDRSIGFVDAWPYVHQDVFTRIDPLTGRPEYDPDRKPGLGKPATFCPSFWGGKTWPPAAYHPGTGLLYIPANDNLCMTMEGEPATYEPGKRFVGVPIRRNRGMFLREGTDSVGALIARDPATGREVWRKTFDSPNWGPVLATGGGLVFMGGTNDRYFRAFDAETGEILWQQRTSSGITGVPTSYAVDGVQYVAVQSGWGVDAQKMQSILDGVQKRSTYVPQGGVLWVFALPQDRDGRDELVEIHRRIPRGPSVETPEAIEADRRLVESLRLRLDALDPSSFSRSDRIDYLLVRARLDERAFDHRVLRPWSRDPLHYLDRIRRLPYTGIPAADAEAFRAGLREVPLVLDRARKNLTETSAELGRLALRHLEEHDGVGQGEPLREPPVPGILGWYRDLEERIAKGEPALSPDASRARDAVVSFRDWLQERIPHLTASAAIGIEEYDWYLRHVRLLPYTSEDVERLGARELDRALTFLEIEKNRNRGLPELALATSREQYDRMVDEAERQIRRVLEEENLVTVPPGAPPRFETDAFFTTRPGGKRHFWEELQYRNPLNNHVHASIPGHRFDALLQSGVTNEIRAAHRDGARSEGWSFYIEEMLLQAGLLDELPRVRELFYVAQLARAVRIPAELAMQRGEMTLDEAVDFMVDLVPFMEVDLARYDLQIYLRRPAYGMNYTVGMAQVEEVLARSALSLGSEFDLGKFHDAFLSKGMIPVSLIGWEMTGDDRAYAWLWEGSR